MTREVYILLLRLHPEAFRRRFGDEMLAIFDRSARKSPLLCDGLRSLLRQWLMRPHPHVPSPIRAADGVPVFYSGESEAPRPLMFMPGLLVAFLTFSIVVFTLNHRWARTNRVVGSHHPSPSHILSVRSDAKPVADLPAEIKLRPYPFHPPMSPYFRMILVLGALDADHDNVISAAEIANAPAALWALDKDGDGKLIAEECGLKPDSNADLGRARLTFMRVHPVLAALDANQDGEISADEIRNAPASLRTLDTNRDGRLTENELRPNRAFAMAVGIMEMLDKNGDGRISREERETPTGVRLRDLLNRADRDGKGYVTEEDLIIEFSRQ